MSSQTCDFCSAPDSKYKCASCKAPRQHKAACSAPLSQTTMSTPLDDLTQSNTHAQQSTQLPLPSTSDLQTLFEQYPRLKVQLRQIYQSTQEPSNVPNAGLAEHNARPFPSRTWKPETGFQAGLKSLQATLTCDAGDAEGMSAFMRMLSNEIDLGS